MNIKFFIVNAFTTKDNIFSGSPAGVCVLDSFLTDDHMKKIANQNNLPETAFVVKKEDCYEIRWFSPTEEVSLCGHATLASAYILFHHIELISDVLIFNSIGGALKAKNKGSMIELDFPSRQYSSTKTPDLIIDAIGFVPKMVLESDDYLVVLENQQEIETLNPDLNKLKLLDRRGVVFTAPGITADFVSRVFHPKLGINEDPACGSAHCELIPYWSKRLQKEKLHAKQLSFRPAEFFCLIDGNRVYLQGRNKLYLEGIINV